MNNLSKAVVSLCSNDSSFAHFKILLESYIITNDRHFYADKFVLYHVDLSEEQLGSLNMYKEHIDIVCIPKPIQKKFLGYSYPASITSAFKTWALCDSSLKYDSCIFVDADTIILNGLNDIFNEIEERGYWFIKTNHTLHTYTHPECIVIMDKNVDLRNGLIFTEILGYSKHNAYITNLLKETYRYAGIKKCLNHSMTNYTNDDFKGHRHDQSILSILLWSNIPADIRTKELLPSAPWKIGQITDKSLFFKHRCLTDIGELRRLLV
jgi:hypothetical protein